MLMEYIVCSLRIVAIIDMVEVGFVEEILLQSILSHAIIRMTRRSDKNIGMTNISRISNFTLEILFSSMIVSF